MLTGQTLIRTLEGVLPVELLYNGIEVYTGFNPHLSKVKSITKVPVNSIAVLKLKFGELLEFYKTAKILSKVNGSNYEYLDLNNIPNYIVGGYYNSAKLSNYPIQYCCNNDLLFQEYVYNIELENNTENSFLHIKFKNSNITLFIKP